MSAATSSVNKKLQDGTLISIGGTSAEDLVRNLAFLLGDDEANEIVAEIKRAFTPTAAGSAPAPQQQVQQAVQTVQNAFPQAQPVAAQQGGAQVETCPSHGQPVVWKPRKDGSGSFAVCTVNDSIVSNFGRPGLRNACPPPKAR